MSKRELCPSCDGNGHEGGDPTIGEDCRTCWGSGFIDWSDE